LSGRCWVPSEPPVWARRDGADWLLDLHVQPGANVTAAVGEHGDRLKLKIAAPPVDNKANALLLASRQKTVAVSGVEPPWRDIEKINKA
jgi:uncharacterized protein YggU (UPF0235/DUF167 family)